MGLVIVMIVGAVFGWLVSIVIEHDDRVAAVVCALAGSAGAVTGALMAGNVPLFAGVSPMQLVWAGLGAAVAILAINAAGANRPALSAGKRLTTRRSIGTNRTAYFEQGEME